MKYNSAQFSEDAFSDGNVTASDCLEVLQALAPTLPADLAGLVGDLTSIHSAYMARITALRQAGKVTPRVFASLKIDGLHSIHTATEALLIHHEGASSVLGLVPTLIHVVAEIRSNEWLLNHHAAELLADREARGRDSELN